MLKVYGSDLCSDCLLLKESLAFNKIEYEYIDITRKIKDLANFLALREENDLYKEVKKKKKIGIPTLVLEDKTITLDWQAYLVKNGYEVIEEIEEEKTCDLKNHSC